MLRVRLNYSNANNQATDTFSKLEPRKVNYASVRTWPGVYKLKQKVKVK